MNEVIRKLVLTDEKQFNYLHKKRTKGWSSRLVG